MPRFRFSLGLTIAALVAAGCGVNAAPGTLDPTFSTPQVFRQFATVSLPPGVSAVGLTLEPAVSDAQIGATLPLKATIRGSDGNTYSDPRLITWAVSNPSLGTIDQNGVFSPQAAGTVKIQAVSGSFSGVATLQVHPARFAWQQVISPVRQNLKAVAMINRFEAWAGGDRGSVLHFINGGWFLDPGFTYKDANIKGIAFANAAAGWAVGNRGGQGEIPFIAKFWGGGWQVERLPISSGSVNAVSVVSPTDVWAAGESDGEALLLHYNGKQWLQVESPGKGKLNDIQMLSSKRGFAVGKGNGLARTPFILTFQDGSWRQTNIWQNRSSVSLINQLELNAIKMVSETQGYAVGTRDALLTNPRGLFLVYDPRRGGWTEGNFDSAVKNLDQVPLYDLEMISGTEGWALGEARKPDWTFGQRNPQSIFGNLLVNDGGVLKLETNYFSGSVSTAYKGINLLPTGEGFVVGDAGVILQRAYDWRGMQNGDFTASPPPISHGPGGEVLPSATPSASASPAQ